MIVIAAAFVLAFTPGDSGGTANAQGLNPSRCHNIATYNSSTGEFTHARCLKFGCPSCSSNADSSGGNCDGQFCVCTTGGPGDVCCDLVITEGGDACADGDCGGWCPSGGCEELDLGGGEWMAECG